MTRFYVDKSISPVHDSPGTKPNRKIQAFAMSKKVKSLQPIVKIAMLWTADTFRGFSQYVLASGQLTRLHFHVSRVARLRQRLQR